MSKSFLLENSNTFRPTIQDALVEVVNFIKIKTKSALLLKAIPWKAISALCTSLHILFYFFLFIDFACMYYAILWCPEDGKLDYVWVSTIKSGYYLISKKISVTVGISKTILT